MIKTILPGAWELTQDKNLPLYSLSVPTQWRQGARYLAEQRSRITRKYPSVPVSSLDPIVSASFPQIIKTVRKGWQQPGIPWLYALEKVDSSHVPDLIKDWLREEFTWHLKETVDNVLNNLNNSDWQWDNTPIDLSLLEPPKEDAVDFRFQAISDYIVKRFVEEDNTVIFHGENNVEYELKFYPVVRLNNNYAELVSYPPEEVSLIVSGEHKGMAFVSFVIRFSLQTVPRRKKPLIYHHLSVRRWISEPLERLPYKGATAFIGDNRRWLDGTRQPYTFIPLKAKEKGIPARWHSAISRLMMLNDSQLPEPELIAQQPQYNWSNRDEQPEGIQIAIPYDSRHTFKHSCLPGVSPRDLASLDAAIIERISYEKDSLPLQRVGEAEEIPKAYFSYWGEKVKNDSSDFSTPMHRPSLAAPAVFAEREAPLKTILVVWETKQCRDELIKEICTRLYITPATETRTYTTTSGGEVQETNYTGEYGSICIKTMHVADLTQNFQLNCTVRERLQRRIESLEERIQRIRTYLPDTDKLCGAIIEIKYKPKIPETDPKNAWRIGAAQANYLNQHINSITAKKKGSNRVKSAVSDLFRQFGILPTSSKKLIDPDKDGISLHTWFTCFYVLRRTRQTTVSNLPSTVVLMLRVNPINGEVEMTTPAWFQDDTKGWLSYTLAEQLLLNERWDPDSYIDEATQEENEEETSTRKEREQTAIDRFVTDCLQDCLNTPIENEQSPHVLFMAEAQNARKLLKWLQNPCVPQQHNILPGQLKQRLTKQEKERLSIVRFRETKQNEVPVAILKDKPGSRAISGVYRWKDICDDSNQNIYLSIRKGAKTEQGLLRKTQSRLDNGKQGAGNTKPIEIVIIYSSTIEQDILARFVHNLRDRNPYYSDFNTLPFPFSLAIPTKEYAIGIRDRIESEQLSVGEEE